MIRLKKVRVKCMVKGCRNSGNKVATFNVSASHESGRGVIMCSECIKGANEALMAIEKAHKPHVEGASVAPENEAPEKAKKAKTKTKAE